MSLELKRAPGQQRALEEPNAANRETKLQAWNQRCNNGNVERRVSASVSRRDDSFAFLHRIDAVDGGNRDFFLCPAWPVNLHLVDFHCCSEAEVQALIGTRCIASTAEDVSALPRASRCDKDLGSDRITGTLGASQQL